MTSSLISLGLCSLAMPGGAQTVPQNTNSAPAAADTPQRVEVRSAGEWQARRDALDARIVVGREELLKQGDSNLADALRRVPGITISTTGGRSAEIRMSGLGGGYTQVLLNGEPVPPGFSLESLSPDLIERVEVSRSPGVDQSAQAIAGSVNIVLRRTARSSQRDLKLGGARVLERPTASIDGNLGDREGPWSWGLGVGLVTEDQVWPMALTLRATDASGRLVQAYDTDKREFDRSDSLNLTPRLSYAPSDHDSVATDHLIRVRRSTGGALDRRTALTGDDPVFGRNDLYLVADTVQWRGRLNWTRQLDEGAKLEAKLAATYARRASEAEFDGWNVAGQPIRDARVHSVATDQGASAAGKYRRPLGESHALTVGWDGEYARRDEDRIQREQALDGGLPVENLDEVYRAGVTRLALFAQDEWVLDPQWNAALGWRWEGLRTVSQGNVFDGVTRQTSVFSPVLRLVWKLPQSKDQLRLGLARTYKAPTPRELMPRRFVANENSPTTPDLQGNPELRPELSWGLDAAWEHFVGNAGIVSVAAYAKRIDDVILDEVSLQQVNGDEHWVQTRSNQGVARVWGVELETKLDLRKRWAEAPPIELRANIGWNRSLVESVPGPDNRLARQTPYALNVGADWRGAEGQWSAGGNFNLQGGGPVRQSATRWGGTPTKRLLDVYLAWKPDAQNQWRLALNNLLHPREVTPARVEDDGWAYRQRETLRTGTAVRLSWEHKL
ncbi:TonB-dependent receptor [Ideonella sp. DXS29W]|uniref:TonB-dependent receptor n=1 Tax=Ideonella lacteola TaxID=2984193 RepID=A0ABU9BUV6_9BURK